MNARVTVSISRSTGFASLWDLVLLCAFLMGAFTTIWIPERWEPKCVFAASLIAIALSCWSPPMLIRRRQHAEPIRQWLTMTALTLVAIVLMYVGCRWLGAFHGLKILELSDKSWTHWLIVKLPTVVGQQIMLQLLLAPILLRLFRRTRVAVVVGASIFGLLHLPNPVLVALTFIAGLFWISAYFHNKQLAPIIVSHFVLAILAAGFCGEYIFNMRVGPSCLAMFPQPVSTAGDVRYEFPECVIGCAERLTQQGDELIIEGWALDPIHNSAPTELFSIADGQLKKIQRVEFQRVNASNWERASRSGFVRKTCYSFVARMPVSRTQSSSAVRLMGANANGHLGRIGQMGEIVSIDDMLTNRPIVVFPVDVDGRVNQVVRHPDGLHLRGWAADLRGKTLPRQICLKYDGQMRTIDLESRRHARPDIAKVLDESEFELSGFDIDLGPISIFYLKNMQCFAVDDQQRLHPIQLTEHAENSVAKLMDGLNGNTIWR